MFEDFFSIQFKILASRSYSAKDGIGFMSVLTADFDKVKTKEGIHLIYTESLFKKVYDSFDLTDPDADTDSLNEAFQLFANKVYQETGLLPLVHLYDRHAKGLNLNVLGSPLVPYLKIHLDDGSVKKDKSVAAFCVTRKITLSSGRSICIAITPPHDHTALSALTLLPLLPEGQGRVFE